VKTGGRALRLNIVDGNAPSTYLTRPKDLLTGRGLQLDKSLWSVNEPHAGKCENEANSSPKLESAPKTATDSQAIVAMATTIGLLGTKINEMVATIARQQCDLQQQQSIIERYKQQFAHVAPKPARTAAPASQPTSQRSQELRLKIRAGKHRRVASKPAPTAARVLQSTPRQHGPSRNLMSDILSFETQRSSLQKKKNKKQRSGLSAPVQYVSPQLQQLLVREPSVGSTEPKPCWNETVIAALERPGTGFCCPSTNPIALVPCSRCKRTFSALAAAQHIPVCKGNPMVPCSRCARTFSRCTPEQCAASGMAHICDA
jgi:hypothetical protein